jgi:hypothetical protein
MHSQTGSVKDKLRCISESKERGVVASASFVPPRLLSSARIRIGYFGTTNDRMWHREWSRESSYLTTAHAQAVNSTFLFWFGQTRLLSV